jgi:chromosome segregation protein
MVYIKKLVMQGFKSFPKKTEILFTPGINVILGANGSGKSNISDALCFVLGRLSIKSMRAEKSKNLIFLGTKDSAPTKEAIVELVFDNVDKIFSFEQDEISIKRIVRKNGQSIYKINNETKTRQEVLSLLAQAGIDPNGFNIILQGEIQNLVRMHTEERRKIIEEVSGISVYESRKYKSLKELEKIEERLKEISAILKERTSYLNNLEKERQQALKYKKLEKDIKKYKASITSYNLVEKKKQAKIIEENINKKSKEIEKIKKILLDFENSINDFKLKIDSINSVIRDSTGLEQEKINREIADIRADLAGLNVKIENMKNKSGELKNQEGEYKEIVSNNEFSINQLQKESSIDSEKQKELENKKKDLEDLEKQRKNYYMKKSELKSLKQRIHDKEILLHNYTDESIFLTKQIENLSIGLFDKKTDSKKLEGLRISLNEKRNSLENLNKKEIEFEKESYTKEYEIEKQRKLLENISKMDICPVCRSKITPEHLDYINKTVNEKVTSLKKQIKNTDKQLSEIEKNKSILNQDIEQIASDISKSESDLIKISNILGKQEQIKNFQNKKEKEKKEILELKKREKYLENQIEKSSNIEQKCETIRIELQEISLRTEENIDSEISFKKRELERAKISLKQLIINKEELDDEISETEKEIEQKQKLLNEKREKDEELNKKFKRLIEQKEEYDKKIKESMYQSMLKKNSWSGIEGEINNFKIDKAKIDAEIENLEVEMLEFSGTEIIKAKKENLIYKLNKTQEIFSKIGSVNLRSLEVYDSIKKEYESIKDKMEIIVKEKESILSIISKIDIQKKKVFIKTLNSLNDIFSRNFSQLSIKGHVWLELENKKEPFEGGVNIIVKTGHGKYFEVTSLSGGEQTLIALSLIFAIQELNPYYFYMLDEIDAALDKRNSERLAGLLRRYMQKGQYIIITHNDEIMNRATNLYGVSMHDGISKIISLKV